MADKHVNAEELIKLLEGYSYDTSQVHHTYKPDHSDFTGSNHQALQNGMRDYHVNTRGWQDIGQHVTSFPDGTFLTGRDFGTTPAGIAGYNTGAFMMEIIGNFDKGKDKLEGKQLKAVLKVYNYLISKGSKIMFHREKANKSCPGTGLDKDKFVKSAKNFKDDGKADISVSGGSSSAPAKKKTNWNSVGSKWTGQVLRKNDRGGAVKDLQKLVGVTADGMFGDDTKKAVRQAQTKAKIAVDGTPGKDTYAALKGHKTKRASDMAIDGKWGKSVTKGLQRYFGTPVDGIMSKQSKNKVTRALYSNTARWGSGGSVVIKAMQKKLGVAADGLLGPASIRALQKRMGTPVDGKLSKISPMVKELQKRLNSGKF